MSTSYRFRIALGGLLITTALGILAAFLPLGFAYQAVTSFAILFGVATLILGGLAMAQGVAELLGAKEQADHAAPKGNERKPRTPHHRRAA